MALLSRMEKLEKKVRRIVFTLSFSIKFQETEEIEEISSFLSPPQNFNPYMFDYFLKYLGASFRSTFIIDNH